MKGTIEHLLLVLLYLVSKVDFVPDDYVFPIVIMFKSQQLKSLIGMFYFHVERIKMTKI